MSKKAKENRLIFFISGLFVTSVSIYINLDDVIHNRFPDAGMLFALGINQLLMATFLKGSSLSQIHTNLN